MANIKPSEISSILQMQLQNMSNKVQFEEIGKVLQVSDGVAHVYGLDKVQSNELVEFENGTMGVVLNLEEDNVGVVLLGPTEGIKEGETVKRTQRIASVMAGEGMLGRVVDGLGRPIDGKGPIQDLRNAFGTQGSGRHLPPTREPAAANRTQGHRCHDSHRARPA